MNKQLNERYSQFEDLPNHIKNALKRLDPGDLEVFINKSIVKLGGKTIIEILNEEGDKGESKIFAYINEMLSLYGGKA